MQSLNFNELKAIANDDVRSFWWQVYKKKNNAGRQPKILESAMYPTYLSRLSDSYEFITAVAV